ncbi:PRTRC system protein E [Herbaspirillum sp. HC18]|nr:PRTRC system protein E [Herbaspirillum sp. HC18]
MTMFTELYALAATATLTMVVSADEKSGRLTISVLPKPKKDVGEPALTKDLTLTAAPEEFDAGFVDVLRGYREKRASLMEQAEATSEVLEAAKSLHAKKATDAMTMVANPSQAAASPSVSAEPEEPGADGTAGQGGGNAALHPAPGESLALFG